jgi:hypothetical protein
LLVILLNFGIISNTICYSKNNNSRIEERNWDGEGEPREESRISWGIVMLQWILYPLSSAHYAAYNPLPINYSTVGHIHLHWALSFSCSHDDLLDQSVQLDLLPAFSPGSQVTRRTQIKYIILNST